MEFRINKKNLKIIFLLLLQGTINAFADFWIASALSHLPGKIPGYIDLPNLNQTVGGIPLINEGYFKLYDGTFGYILMTTLLISITNYDPYYKILFQQRSKKHQAISRYCLK